MRKWFVAQEMRRFLLVGTFNTLATYLVYVGLLIFLQYLYAYTISFVLGILVSWLLNARYSFQTAATRKNLGHYAIVYVTTWLFGLFALSLLIETLGVHHLVAPLIIVALVTPVNFMLARFTLLGGKSTK